MRLSLQILTYPDNYRTRTREPMEASAVDATNRIEVEPLDPGQPRRQVRLHPVAGCRSILQRCCILHLRLGRTLVDPCRPRRQLGQHQLALRDRRRSPGRLLEDAPSRSPAPTGISTVIRINQQVPNLTSTVSVRMLRITMPKLFKPSKGAAVPKGLLRRRRHRHCWRYRTGRSLSDRRLRCRRVRDGISHRRRYRQ